MAKIVPQTGIAYFAEHPLLFFRNLSSDVILVAIAVAFLIIYGIYLGKEKLVSLLFSLYVAALMYSTFPYANNLILFKQTAGQITVSRITVFAVFVIFSEIILRKVISPIFTMSKVRGWADNALLSIANVASFIVIGYKVLSFAALYTPTIISVNVLVSSVTFFWVMICSFAILYFSTK